MAINEFFAMIFSVIGGLGIFLVGMRYMSDGLQAVAGERLRKMISLVTDNRIIGLIMGLLVTCIVQSSSITTVMAVGLVNSGFMTLIQSIGVIYGANIGTTITGWILVLDIGKYGLPILGVSAFFFLFSKREKVRYTGMVLMGIGMVFFGLELMKSGFTPMRNNEAFRAWFHAFDASTYPGIIKCAITGCILTLIVQSSSATLGITMGLASSGVIPFSTAAALVIGENVGTTITAFLATLGANTTAKRSAWAHILFNVLGTAWFILLFPVVTGLIAQLVGHDPNTMILNGNEQTYPYMMRAIATVHSSFNIINALVFLPMTGALAWLVTKIVPDTGKKEINKLEYFDIRLAHAPALGIVQSREQIVAMGQANEKMFSYLRSIMENPAGNPELEDKLFRREEIVDEMQKEVVVFLGRLLSGEVTHEVSDEARGQIRMADEYETLSDYQSYVLKGIIKLRKNGLSLSEDGRSDLLQLHDSVAAYVRMINQAVEADDANVITRARADGDNITREMKQIRKRHLQRLGDNQIAPLKSLIYMDFLNHYRRMKDHAFNVAEVIAGEK